MSEKSFNRYKLVMPILDNVFSKLDFTICQGTKDLKRFIELGVNQDRVIKDCSFKFDSLSIQNERDNFENKGKKLIICASTHDPEEKILVKAFSMLNNENAILVLVPRHPERASKIIKDIKKLGINPSLFSHNNLKIDLSDVVFPNCWPLDAGFGYF